MFNPKCRVPAKNTGSSAITERRRFQALAASVRKPLSGNADMSVIPVVAKTLFCPCSDDS